MFIQPKKFWLAGTASLYAGVTLPTSFMGSASTNITGAVLTSSTINIGTASADRLIVATLACQNSTTVTSITVNGTSLSAVVNTAGSVAIFAGLVTTGSGTVTITATWASGSFQLRGFAIYALKGLSSNTVKQTASLSASGPLTISVTAGDFMFAANESVNANANFSTSTQVPTANHSIFSSNPWGTASDWIIASTNASFSANPLSGISTSTILATWQ